MYVSTDITNALGKKQILRTMNYRGSLMSTSIKIDKTQLKKFSLVKKPSENDFVGAYLCNVGAYSCIKNIWIGFEDPKNIATKTGGNFKITLNIFPVLLVKDHFEYSEEKKEFLEDNFIYDENIPVIGTSEVSIKADGSTNTLANIYYNIADARYTRDTLHALLKKAFEGTDKEVIFDQQRNNMNVALMFSIKAEDATISETNAYINIEYVEGSPSAVSDPEIAYSGIYKK